MISINDIINDINDDINNDKKSDNVEISGLHWNDPGRKDTAKLAEQRRRKRRKEREKEQQ